MSDSLSSQAREPRSPPRTPGVGVLVSWHDAINGPSSYDASGILSIDRLPNGSDVVEIPNVGEMTVVRRLWRLGVPEVVLVCVQHIS